MVANREDRESFLELIGKVAEERLPRGEELTREDYSEGVRALILYAKMTGVASSYKELGELVGLDSSHLNRISNGKTTAIKDTYDKMIVGLGLSRDVDPRRLGLAMSLTQDVYKAFVAKENLRAKESELESAKKLYEDL